ncbi:Exodeoxyribonuclease 7 small subunit [Limihaloglobus sulfuriphilus]|uniref:Exodeoxyribonuclease 7 small subunit n=1 Tax=Limihaloglobus sulfuriphilus TaxID=1851148 RepID=A0A1Q2MD06_9BACT|nr:exodeoxyribonuclease VII small subunit [Limihaloglobus sulfuriphilus]AQQ70575.1 Exodeoxyribonuclease 7 small subunit [Limihaloglobus sulfuriphilus]
MDEKEMKKNLDKMTFKDTILELENIVKSIESGDFSLEDSLDKYERGMRLIGRCREILRDCEQRVKKISEEQEAE